MWLRVSSMSAWDHLPNARHIDWVIASLKKHPDLWRATWIATARPVGQRPAWIAGYNAALNAAHTSHSKILAAISDDAPMHAPDESYGAMLALITYDDCDQYLAMTSEELRAWVLLTEHPTAMLLLPMVIVREQIEQRESA